MKKDGIQTRNRKLSAKSKKKRGSMVDFFAPFDSKSFSAYGGMAGKSYLLNINGSCFDFTQISFTKMAN